MTKPGGGTGKASRGKSGHPMGASLQAWARRHLSDCILTLKHHQYLVPHIDSQSWKQGIPERIGTEEGGWEAGLPKAWHGLVETASHYILDTLESV